MAERITYSTIDEVNIVGDWLPVATISGVVILLHMMPANRRSWAAFQLLLAKRGLASLAIDLRGHGDSVDGPGGAKIDYRKFSDEEHQSTLLDVIGAGDWLRRRGLALNQIALAGASIGANLALQFLLEEPQITGAALLSPGNYHGIDALREVSGVLPNQSLWLAASSGDDQESFDASQKIFTAAPSDRKLFVPLKNAGHGTTILNGQPQVAESLADWLKQTIQGE